MDYLRLLSLQISGGPEGNEMEHCAPERGIGGGAQDGRDGDGHVSGSETITNALRLVNEDLHGVVSKLHSALQDAQMQLLQSEKAYQSLYQENTELKKILALYLNQQQTQRNGSPKSDLNALHGTNTVKADSQPSFNAAGNSKYISTPAPRDDEKAKAFLPSPEQSLPFSNSVRGHLHAGTSGSPHIPIHNSGSVQSHPFEINTINQVKRLNSMIMEGANSLSTSIVSVTPNPTNATPVPKDPEWQGAFQVSTLRLGKFLAKTIAQEAQKPRLILNAQLIHITLSTFFTSLVAEWSGWYSASNSISSSDVKDVEEEANFGAIESNRDVETALSEFAKVCLIAKWNTNANADWDAAFERQLTSFLIHATKMGPFLMHHPHDIMSQGMTSDESARGDEYRPLFVPAGSRFSVEKMDDLYQYKENEKGARKIASCVGFGLSSGTPQDGTLRLLIKPKVIQEATLFETLNPPQPVFQAKAWSRYAGNGPQHAKPRGGWSSKNWKHTPLP